MFKELTESAKRVSLIKAFLAYSVTFFLVQEGLAQGGGVDSDADGLDDTWEVTHFGDLVSQDASGDPDGDGYLNSEELNLGLDPNVAAGAPGYLSFDVWSGIPGANVADLVSSAQFYEEPDLEFLTLGASEAANLENYGSRLRGTLTAPVTGSYTFWVTGDDATELWLSSDNRKFGRQLIAWNIEAAGGDQYDDNSSQQSAPIALVAGNEYYIEVLHKQSLLDDHLSVAWSYETDDLVNWVLEPGAAATQSSTVAGGVASRAIDGNRDGVYASRSTTYTNPSGVNSWWQVDLGENRNVERVVLFNRTDNHSARLSNFTVSVLDDAGNVLDSEVYHTEEGFVADSVAWDLEAPVVARTIRISLNGQNLAGDGGLHLAEVEVMGSLSGAGNMTPLSYLTNWTQEAGVSAAQSSTVAGGVAVRAIDGNTSGVYSDSSTTYTNPNQANGWWEVDLGVMRSVTRIKIFNRTDKHMDRLSNFRIRLLDDAGQEVHAEDFFVDQGAASYQLSWDVPTSDIQKVRIERLGLNREGNQAIHLAEVQVLGFQTIIPGAIQGREPLPVGALASYVLDPDDPDDDGLPSAWETQYGFDPLVAEGFDQGAFGDPDDDLLSNWQEYQLGTDPTVPSSIQGGLTQEVWYDLGHGGELSALYETLGYYQEADSRRLIYQSEATRYLGSGIAVKVRGYIEAPVTGDYRFWLSGSTEVRCWLSTDDSKFNKELLISPHLASAYHQYDLTNSQQSAVIPMVAGQKYFVEMHYTETGAGGWSPVSLAWQPPGESRSLIPGESLYTFTIPANDLDDDDLPDDWEVTNGLDATDNGATDWNNGPQGDLDGDGLSNHEEYQAGTRADLVDSDGDGVDDYTEVVILETSALVGDVAPFQLESTVDGANYIASGGEWGTAGTSAISRSVRGWIEYSITVPQDGVYLLDAAISPRLSGLLSSDYQFLFSIDGSFYDRVATVIANGTTGNAQSLTPWLSQGTHTVRIFNENALTFRRITLESLSVLSAQGTDGSGNGVPDWVDYQLASTNEISSSMTFSKVSPAFIEGQARYLSALALSGGLVPTAMANEAWSVDLPLDENTSVTLDATFENGAFIESHPVTWEPTNLLQESTLTLRQNDALRLTAFTGNSANGSDKVWLTIDGVTYDFKGKDPMVWTFASVGTHVIDVVHRRGNGNNASETTNQVTVEVIAPTTIDSPVALLEHTRKWSIGVLPAGTVVEFDDQVEVRDVAVAADGSTTYDIMSHTPETAYAQVRLGASGPILQSIPVRGLTVRDAEKTSIQYIQDFGDGSYQVDMPVVASEVYHDVTVTYNIFLAGITFDDGSILKDYTAPDFDEFGQSLVTFIKTGTNGSACHRTRVFHDGVLIGWFF